MIYAQNPIRLIGDIVRIDDVSPMQRDEMFQLMCQYYENMDQELFEQDFLEKDWAIVARDPRQKRILGFSTQLLIDAGYNQGASNTRPESGRPRKVLFSGDTIMDRAYWNRNPLAQLWGRLTLTLIDKYPKHDLFWFLISKGYKTYRFLPVFFHEFYPRYDVPTPNWASELIGQLASHRYPAQFDEPTGIIRACQFGCQLQKGVAELTAERRHDKHVDFFHRRNPGHVLGDELCCIAPLTRANFKPGAFRVIGQHKVVTI